MQIRLPCRLPRGTLLRAFALLYSRYYTVHLWFLFYEGFHIKIDVLCSSILCSIFLQTLESVSACESVKLWWPEIPCRVQTIKALMEAEIQYSNSIMWSPPFLFKWIVSYGRFVYFIPSFVTGLNFKTLECLDAVWELSVLLYWSSFLSQKDAVHVAQKLMVGLG